MSSLPHLLRYELQAYDEDVQITGKTKQNNISLNVTKKIKGLT